MSLSALIRKGGLGALATATSATTATESRVSSQCVATVASVAVATSVSAKGRLTCLLVLNGEYKEIAYSDFEKITFRDLYNRPYLLRFENAEGWSYFTGDEYLFLQLQSEGKVVRWLHTLLQSWTEMLISQGLPLNTSIYLWSVEDVRFWLNAFQVFPGAQIIREGEMSH